MSTAVATRQPSNFEIELANYEPQIAAALPTHIPIERFKRTVLTAINQNPDLMVADRRSLFLSCVRAAQDGLLPDGREAALVIFNTKVKKNGREEWIKAVQYLPMVAGIIKRMRNSGDVSAVDSQLVHQHDEFTYRLGDDPKIEHKPALTNRGEAIAAYAIIRLTNGEVLREVMGRDDIERVRAVSRAKDKGPWVDWWGEMARKTVLRRCSKRAPVSSDIDEMLRRDDEELFDQQRQERTLAVAPARPTRAQFQTVESEPNADPFTIMTGEGQERTFADAHDAADALIHRMELAESGSGEDGLVGIWESNGLLFTQLRERGHVDVADTLRKLYDDRLSALTEQRKEAKSAADAAASIEGAQDAAAPPVSRQGAAVETGAAQEQRQSDDEPDPKLVKEWTEFGTARTVMVVNAKTTAALDKLEKSIRPHLPDYAQYVGAEKALALTDLIAARRAELAPAGGGLV